MKSEIYVLYSISFSTFAEIFMKKTLWLWIQLYVERIFLSFTTQLLNMLEIMTDFNFINLFLIFSQLVCDKNE